MTLIDFLVRFSAERREFLKHLATLRGEANTFLAMLNDTRRQVRELYYSGSNGDGAVGIQAYRYSRKIVSPNTFLTLLRGIIAEINMLHVK